MRGFWEEDWSWWERESPFLACAFAGSRVLRQIFFGIQRTDPVTFVLVAGLVLAIALIACAVPVARAVRNDPTTVLQAM